MRIYYNTIVANSLWAKFRSEKVQILEERIVTIAQERIVFDFILFQNVKVPLTPIYLLI